MIINNFNNLFFISPFFVRVIKLIAHNITILQNNWLKTGTHYGGNIWRESERWRRIGRRERYIGDRWNQGT